MSEYPYDSSTRSSGDSFRCARKFYFIITTFFVATHSGVIYAFRETEMTNIKEAQQITPSIESEVRHHPTMIFDLTE